MPGGNGPHVGVPERLDCAALCAARGWEVALLFEDNDALCEPRQARRAYERMLSAVEEDALDTVVTWHDDRLHHSPKELEAFIGPLTLGYTGLGMPSAVRWGIAGVIPEQDPLT